LVLLVVAGFLAGLAVSRSPKDITSFSPRSAAGSMAAYHPDFLRENQMANLLILPRRGATPGNTPALIFPEWRGK
jgi:hypothetical protein